MWEEAQYWVGGKGGRTVKACGWLVDALWVVERRLSPTRASTSYHPVLRPSSRVVMGSQRGGGRRGGEAAQNSRSRRGTVAEIQ